MLPKLQLPVSINVIRSSSFLPGVCMFLLSSTFPSVLEISFFTIQCDGTIISSPPKATFKSMVIVFSVVSAFIRLISVPPNVVDTFPPLKFFEVTISLCPPKVTSTFSKLSLLVMVLILSSQLPSHSFFFLLWFEDEYQT